MLGEQRGGAAPGRSGESREAGIKAIRSKPGPCPRSTPIPSLLASLEGESSLLSSQLTKPQGLTCDSIGFYFPKPVFAL